MPAGEPVSGLMYAVCTHARHDKCCAKFGRPVYCAFRDMAGEQAWECSHVGGDRFAGNVVVFPYGLYYGRVSPDDVPAIIQASERGEVWMKGYRGRSCFGRALQVAEYFVRAESGRLRINEFEAVDISRQADTQSATLRSVTDGSLHEVVFRMSDEPLRQMLTCGATDASAVPRYELIAYRARTR